MSEDNKPDNVANPEETTDAQKESAAIGDRLAEGRQQQETGDVMTDVMKGVKDTNPDQENAAGGATDVAAQGSNSEEDAKAGVDAALALINASTGREFPTLEEARKHIQNLNKLVGDQEVAKARDAQKALDDLVSKYGKSPKDLDKVLADTLLEAVSEVTKEPDKVDPEVKPKVEPVKEDLEKEEKKDVTKFDVSILTRLEKLEHAEQVQSLKEKYPTALAIVDEIATIARSKEISYVEAFENSPLKSLVELKQKEDAQKNPVVTPSNRANIDYQKAQDLGRKALSGRATEEEKEELVKTVLGL